MPRLQLHFITTTATVQPSSISFVVVITLMTPSLPSPDPTSAIRCAKMAATLTLLSLVVVEACCCLATSSLSNFVSRLLRIAPSSALPTPRCGNVSEEGAGWWRSSSARWGWRWWASTGRGKVGCCWHGWGEACEGLVEVEVRQPGQPQWCMGRGGGMDPASGTTKAGVLLGGGGGGGPPRSYTASSETKGD